MSRLCCICGAEFDARGRAKTCGPECSRAHRAGRYERSKSVLRVTPDSKSCGKCMRVLPSSDFQSDPRMASGLRSYCRKCTADWARENYASNREHIRELGRKRARETYDPERRRWQGIKHLYGLTREGFDAMLAAQNGRCAICGSDEPGGKTGTWHIDHCHETARVRALLCANCNVGIGHLDHDPERLRAAADYIEMHSQKERTQ